MQPIEIVERRTEGAKTFIVGHKPDGSPILKVRAATRPIHYRKDGRWLDVDPRWEDGVLRGCKFAGARLGGVGCTLVRLCDYADSAPEPEIHGRRVWWRGIERDADAVLVISPHRYQLHVILRSERAPRSYRWEYPDGPQPIEVGGRDNVDGLIKRHGKAQTYAIEIETEFGETIARKTWTGRVKARDAERRPYWSEDVVYPVRMI